MIRRMPERQPVPVITIGHSPDPDDAFMWWALGHAGDRAGAPGERAPEIDTGRFLFRVVLSDIETLNRRAEETGDLDVTAISAHAYPRVKDRYAITSCGSSLGDGYGPKVVAREKRGADWLGSGVEIAVPGERTSAFLALRLLMGKEFRFRVVPFDQIIEEVAEGRADAGLVIHEGQLTFQERGLAQVVDLGAWWKSTTGSALPLGLNAVRRDVDARFGAGSGVEIARVLRSSIEFGLRKRPIVLERVMCYARGLTIAQADRFVNMYVNPLSRELGTRGAEAIREFLRRGAEAGLCPDPGPVDIVEPNVRVGL